MVSVPKVGIGVLILRDEKVLLGKRNSDPAKADSELHGEGTWSLPGGKLHFQESFEDCARREVLEETGLKVSNFELISISNDIVHDAHFVTIGIKVNEVEGDPKVMEPDEITEWNWFSLDNLPELMFFPAEKIIKNFLENKIYKY